MIDAPTCAQCQTKPVPRWLNSRGKPTRRFRKYCSDACAKDVTNVFKWRSDLVYRKHVLLTPQSAEAGR